MKNNKREMPLINFKGIIGKFVSLEVVTNNYYVDEIPYELTMITEEGYEIKIKPIKQEDADRIIICFQCSNGKKVKCWRG
mgnify:CR=1 FL=1